MVPPSEDAMEGINILLQCAVSRSGLPQPRSEEGLKLLEGVRYLHSMMIFFETIENRYVTPPLALLEKIAKLTDDLPADIYREIVYLLSVADEAKSKSEKEILPFNGFNGENGKGEPPIS